MQLVTEIRLRVLIMLVAPILIVSIGQNKGAGIIALFVFAYAGLKLWTMKCSYCGYPVQGPFGVDFLSFWVNVVFRGICTKCKKHLTKHSDGAT